MSKSMARRGFLANIWKAGAGLLGAAAAWTSWDLLKPVTASGFGGLVRAIPPEAVPEGGVVEVAAARAYLTKVEGEVVAISWKCTHLGCRTPFCASSGQFECPCHGSVFNRAGDHAAGPAPRGLDQYPVELAADGLLHIDTGSTIDGPPPGENTIDEPPLGPPCAEGGHG
jgi:cytochrome b6-f complex iron-sulfur subunit